MEIGSCSQKRALLPFRSRDLPQLASGMAFHFGDKPRATLGHGRDHGAGRVEQLRDCVGERARQALHLADLVDQVHGLLVERERRDGDGVQGIQIDALAADPVRRAQPHRGEPGGPAVERLELEAEPISALAADLVGEKAADSPAGEKAFESAQDGRLAHAGNAGE
jgi:hypothetical protein